MAYQPLRSLFYMIIPWCTLYRWWCLTIGCAERLQTKDLPKCKLMLHLAPNEIGRDPTQVWCIFPNGSKLPKKVECFLCVDAVNPSTRIGAGECKSGNGRRNKLPLQRRAFITAKIEKDSWPSSSPRSWSEWWNAYRMPNMVATDNESHPSRSTMHSIKLRTWGIYFSRVEVENFAINRRRTWSAKWESVTDDNTGLTETTQLHSSIHKVSARARCLEWMDCWMMKFLGLFLNDGEFFCDGAGNKGKNGLAQGCC